MNCPHCQARQTRKLNETTDLGYAVFRCARCQRKFDERTGSPFNHLEFPTDIVFQVVLCRLRYKLSLRDLWPRCSCCAASNSPTKRYGSGRSDSLLCLPSTCGANVGARLDGAGTLMRRT